MDVRDVRPGQVFEKGGRKRQVLGFDGYFVIYRTISSRPRKIGEALWHFEKWLKGANEVTE